MVAQDFGMDTNPRGKPLCPPPPPPPPLGPDRGNNSALLTFLHSAGLALRRAHCRGCQRCSPHPAPPLLLPESKCCVNVGKGLGGGAQATVTLCRLLRSVTFPSSSSKTGEGRGGGGPGWAHTQALGPAGRGSSRGKCG